MGALLDVVFDVAESIELTISSVKVLVLNWYLGHFADM
jgi:hypothetical protein